MDELFIHSPLAVHRYVLTFIVSKTQRGALLKVNYPNG
jgi:hypothetical protein